MLTKVPSFHYVYKADAFHRDEAKQNRDGIADLTRDALLSRWSTKCGIEMALQMNEGGCPIIEMEYLLFV